jgi:hypothetical protein
VHGVVGVAGAGAATLAIAGEVDSFDDEISLMLLALAA